MTEDSYDRCPKRPIWILETPEPRDLKLRTQTLIPDTRHHAKNGLRGGHFRHPLRVAKMQKFPIITGPFFRFFFLGQAYSRNGIS